MARFFNTTGPCDAKRHYMLSPEARLPQLLPLVQQELYFVIHAARQTGKTTAMRAFAARLRALGYAAVWATLEESQGVSDVERAEAIWLGALENAADFQLSAALRPPPRQAFLAFEVGRRFSLWLSAWSSQISIPLVLLLDEADTVSGLALVSLLRQLRAGFMDRGLGKFPTSVALIGMRDLRDYLTQSREGVSIHPGSPFNIKSDSITLRNFNEAEVGSLYAQHTEETGQVFSKEAVQQAFYWTQGQPFLVNALARKCVMEVCTQSEAITAEHIDLAKEKLILSRTTHIDALGQRLSEPRVMPIVQAVLLGDIADQISYRSDDFQYVIDLGLIRQGDLGAEPANPIYREVLARELSYDRQMSLTKPRFRWQKPDGRLDFPALLSAFFDWWRENEESIMARGVKEYPEALPHLALMAFLQRVVNGGGVIHREFSAGRGALDLVVLFEKERFPIEIKRVFVGGKPLERVKQQGIEQLAEYLDTLHETEGWLLVFNQRPEVRAQPWAQRLWADVVQIDGKTLHLWGG